MTQIDYEGKEMEGVEALRRRLKGTMSPEMYADTNMFLRFLRARNHDINAAENMLRNHLNWRKVNKVDTMFQWYTPHEVSQKYIPFTRIGFDSVGSPVTYWTIGNWDIRGCLKAMKHSEYLNYITKILQEDLLLMEKRNRKLNKNVDQWILVIDFENFPLSLATHKPSIEAASRVISLYEGNYPERMKQVFIINASWYFQIAFALIKPLLSGRTLQKVIIHGKSGWPDVLRNIMNIEELPAFLGGNKKDPNGDPMCRLFINHGGLVPESYFAKNRKASLSSQPGVKTLSVSRLSKTQVKLLVLHPGSEIEWEFETKSNDIAFTLLYEENKVLKELFAKQRIDTSIDSESGLFKTEKEGVYYLEFDNTYSWIHNKDVYYKVKVTAPQVQRNES